MKIIELWEPPLKLSINKFVIINNVRTKHGPNLMINTRTMKINDEKTYLSLNPNIKHRNQDKITIAYKKNMKCVNKRANKFLL